MLTTAEAQKLRAVHGPNALPEAPRPHAWLLLVRQLTHFFALLLWGAATLATLAGMPALGVAIVVVVLFNGVFAFAQEYRADRAVDKLRDLLPVTAVVRRDGRRQAIPAAELVPGDLVLLEAGDRISADLNVDRMSALALDESMLTGESEPRRASPNDRLFAGTFVVEGSAEAVVMAIGASTRLAGIAALTGGVNRPPGPLAVRLNRVVRVVGLIALGSGVALYLVAMWLGLGALEGFLFALGVTVALVPEGLLPTVTLALAMGARSMAERKALVRRLEAVETLGSVTFICTDKTGTLTQNRMTVTDLWTPDGKGVAALAFSAIQASSGSDPMEVALHDLAMREGVDVSRQPELLRLPFDPRTLMAQTVTADGVRHVKGAPERVLLLCKENDEALKAAHEMAERGLRVLAIARGPQNAETLDVLGVVGLKDPPRPDVAGAIQACRRAHIRLAVITGDHPGTARAVAIEVGLSTADSPVLTGPELPDDDGALGELLDRDGAIVARVSPEQKLRIARVLRKRGHIVAMTGDGVNDAPALREADIGIAMGASGSDVAREAADLVLLDDNFATIAAAIELGRATFANVRRFLTYHLTDNVAELAPFVAWALTGGAFPLAIGVLQILALDIGTDLLPALALGVEPPNPATLNGSASTGQFIERRLLTRVFGVLGPTEAVMTLTAFAAVLLAGGWRWGASVSPELLSVASGTAFATVVLAQMANAFACRRESWPFFRLDPRRNPLLLKAVGIELAALLVFVGVPPVAGLLGMAWPSPLGWAMALLAIPAVLATDTIHKLLASR